MADALFAGGAGVFLGWSQKVLDPDAHDSGLFIFDQLLGIKTLFPSAHEPTDDLIPDTISEAFSTMMGKTRPEKSYTFGKDKNGSELRRYEATASASALLPAIQNVTVDQENHIIRLTGRFGPQRGFVYGDPAGSKTNLDVLSWEAGRIEVGLQAGISQIQVEYGSLKSNVATVPTSSFTFAEDSVTHPPMVVSTIAVSSRMRTFLKILSPAVP